MKILYTGALEREVVPVDHAPFTVRPGDVVDVPEPLAKSLLEQVDLFGPAPAPAKPEKETK